MKKIYMIPLVEIVETAQVETILAGSVTPKVRQLFGTESDTKEVEVNEGIEAISGGDVYTLSKQRSSFYQSY